MPTLKMKSTCGTSETSASVYHFL